MNVGDAILIYKYEYFTHAGYVSYKLTSPDIADLFWGRNDSGKTWELIYFLQDLTEVNIPINVFNSKIGYRNWKPRGFGRISDSNLENLIKLYGSIGEFINDLSSGRFSIDTILEEAISYQLSEEKPNEEEKVELETEIKAEKIYKGLSAEEKKKRAWTIYIGLKENANKLGPKSKSISTRRFERGQAGQTMKVIYGYRCMVEGCGFTFLKKNGELYAQAHHLESLSDGGPDDPDNIVVLCPNHHAQFHYANVEKESRTNEDLVVKINGVLTILKFKNER
jgi:predicted HNH restriction endonuclease